MNCSIRVVHTNCSEWQRKEIKNYNLEISRVYRFNININENVLFSNIVFFGTSFQSCVYLD